MKTDFFPKTGTVGTSPVHVRDMSRTSATKVLLWLSWNMILLSTVYDFAWIKYSFHNTVPIILLTPMSLLSVEILPLILYFHEPFVMDPAPRNIMSPVCPRQSLCVENYASTHHFITDRLYSLRFILTPNFPLIYFITSFSFPQSSSGGAFNIVVEKSTDVCKFRHTRPLANKRCATTCFNCEACFSDRGIESFSSRTLNKFSVACMGSVVVISYGNSSNAFFMYRAIDTSTCSLVD